MGDNFAPSKGALQSIRSGRSYSIGNRLSGAQFLVSKKLEGSSEKMEGSGNGLRQAGKKPYFFRTLAHEAAGIAVALVFCRPFAPSPYLSEASKGLER